MSDYAYTVVGGGAPFLFVVRHVYRWRGRKFVTRAPPRFYIAMTDADGKVWRA